MEHGQSQEVRAHKTKRPRLSLEKRWKIATLTDQGKLSQEKIAKRVHASLSGVQKEQKKWREYHQLEDLPRPGRPRLFSAKVIRDIDMQVMRDYLLKPIHVKRYLLDRHSIDASMSAVRVMLKRNHIRFYSQRPKPELTQQQKLARLTKAREWKEKMASGTWRKVVFSDEAKIYRAPVRKCRRLLRAGVSPGARGVHEFPKKGGGSIGLWLAISNTGILSWQIFMKGLKATDYIAILNEHISTSVQAHFGRRRFIWQQDNATVHTAKAAKEALTALSCTYGFDVLPWPAYSPDLSLVENVIHLIKQRLRAIADEKGDAIDLEELERRVTEVVNFLNEPAQRHYFRALYSDMPRRVAKVIEAHGASINR